MLKCWKNEESFLRKRPIHGHLIYTGYTNNIVRRLREHKNGTPYGKREPFTSQFCGWLELGYLEAYNSQKEAMNRESELKTFSRDRKIKLIQELEPEEIEIINYVNLLPTK
jgi:putative endonuclease